MRLVFALLLGVLLAPIAEARAEASGPDYWAVVGVPTGDTLNIHVRSSARSKTIGAIPYDATGLKNLGCTGGPTFQQWSRMGEAERARAARARWCRIDYGGTRGWVAGRFLKEGAAAGAGPAVAPTYVKAWTINCPASGCVLEQLSVGANRPTLLRLVPREGSNAEITIERAGMARRGTLTVYMDGETISVGPIAPLATKGAGRLVMTPDDITQGLMKQMARHKNMVLSFPGEERGAEYHLDDFDAAWRQVLARAKR